MEMFESDVKMGGWQDTTLVVAPKRIIVCCDGTWQSSVTAEQNIASNVTRLARYLNKVGKDDQGQQWQQLIYYDAGIGTGVSSLEAQRQGGTGSGFAGNVIEAYNFIVLNYNPGDKIFCLGFSRGAYTARAVAGLVTDIGIVKPRDMQDFPDLFAIYLSHTDSHEFRKSAAWREWCEGKRLFDPKQKGVPDAWKQSPTQWLKRPHGAAPESSRWVEAVGVFDTVGALGIPKVEGWFNKGLVWIAGKAVPVEKFGFHNVALSPYIKNAYHAMALDEHRKPFNTTLWHFPADGVADIPTSKVSGKEMREKYIKLRDTDGVKDAELSKTWAELVDAEMAEELKGSNSNLLQVWFPGVHINIGGGSDDLLKEKESDFEQIAMITLAWMVHQLSPHLSFELSFDSFANADRFQFIRPVIDQFIKEKNTKHWLMKKVLNARAKGEKVESYQDTEDIQTRVLAAEALKGWATGPIIDSFVGEMQKAGSEYRTPGAYKEMKLPSGGTVKMGKTNEQIHPTVQYRRDQIGYDPVALKGFTRKASKNSSGALRYEWVKGDVKIPEYVVPGESLKEMQKLFAEKPPGYTLPAEKLELERRFVVEKSARLWLSKLDKEYGLDTALVWEMDLPPPDKNQQQTGFQPGGFQPGTWPASGSQETTGSGDAFTPQPSNDPWLNH